MIEKHKEVKNNSSILFGSIDDDWLKNITTVNIKINYDGYFKIQQKELELLSLEELKKQILELIVLE